MRNLPFPGTVTLDRGKYRARVMVQGKRTPVGTHASWEEAAGAIAEFWRLHAAEVSQNAGVLTLKEWGRRYLDIRETDGHHRGVDRDRNRWKVRIDATPLAAMCLDTIQPRDVRAWLAEQVRRPSARGKPPGKTTVSNVLNLLRVALEEAVQAGHIQSNPARDVRVPRMASSEEGWSWLRAAEVETLLGGASLAEEQRRIFVVAVYTGLRKGELWGLRWRDVDFDRAELVVSKSYDGPTKGGRVRRVPLLKPALDALRAQPRRCSLVFPTHDVRMRNRNDSAGLDEVLETLKLPHVRFHDLRHTCASHLLQGTWAPTLIPRALRLEELKGWLGHVNITTTQRYAHLCPDAMGALVRDAQKQAETPPKAVDAQWPQVAASASGRARQVMDIIEARTGFEPVCDGFANRARPPVIAQGLAQPRPLGDRISELLTQFARRVRPADMAVIDALAEALLLVREELGRGASHG
jgi:integrase